MSRASRLNGRVGARDITDATGRRLDSMTVLGSPATRTAFAALAATNQTSAPAVVFDYTFRELLSLPFATGRWRIGFANRNNRSTTTLTGPATISGVWVSDTPAYTSSDTTGGRWIGNCTGTPTQVSGALTVPTDGTTVWSSWISGSSNFAAGVSKMLSWGMTTAASGNGIGYGDGFQAVRAAGASQAGNATLTSPTTTTQQILDTVIQYEFATPAQVGLFIGDSNTVALSPSAPPMLAGAGIGTLPSESWPMLAGQLGGFAAINLGVGSATSREFASTLPNLLTRFDLTAVSIDFAVISLGTNNLSTASGLANFMADIQALNATLRSTYGIKRIYWTEIPPRDYSTSFGRLSAGVAAGATSITTDRSVVIDATNKMTIGSGPAMEQVTVSAGPTGSGPYTYTVSALASAHLAAEPVAAGAEMARRMYNNLLRNLPDGITGVVPFEKLLEAGPDEPRCDQRYVASDQLHFHRGANLIRAQSVVAAGVVPRLV